jgi:hypothetical protein
MRFVVEVSSLGKTEKEALHVEAESWQKALQTARAQRGETAPMSGFSIELLEDGCRAVDPMSRLRYEVRKAGEDAASAGAHSGPPRPAAHPPSGSAVAAAASASAKKPAAAPAPAPPRPEVAAQVAPQVLYKREQDATEAMPLTYREYVLLVPPGTTETAAEALLVAQLDMVRSSLERAAPGKLVNLGVFDVAFQGKPPVLPLATLTWKDWRGAPVVTFPRRQPAPAAVAPAPSPSPAPAPATAPPPPATAFAAAPFTPAPFAQTIVQPRPRIASQPRARVRGEDLIADLFEAMHDLHFVRDALEGGEFCLTLAMEKMPSQAGIVHLYDIDHREFLVTSTRGAGTGKLLLRRHPESDPLLSAAMRKQRAIVLPDATRSEAAKLDRFVALGGARSLIVAPAVQSGRFLGAIELCNPLDEQPYTDSEGNALSYIAEQFAQFVASVGIVTDPERISSRQLPEV